MDSEVRFFDKYYLIARELDNFLSSNIERYGLIPDKLVFGCLSFDLTDYEEFDNNWIELEAEVICEMGKDCQDFLHDFDSLCEKLEEIKKKKFEVADWDGWDDETMSFSVSLDFW